MATIKSFTDISQGRKLAEILPIESADMCCFQNQNGDINYYGFPFLQGNKASNPIPCWSLAGLISILPRVDIEKEICSDDTYDYRVKAYIGDGYIGDWFDNPVDACVAIVEKLHELDLL